jgi:hypothetical protein
MFSRGWYRSLYAHIISLVFNVKQEEMMHFLKLSLYHLLIMKTIIQRQNWTILSFKDRTACKVSFFLSALIKSWLKDNWGAIWLPICCHLFKYFGTKIGWNRFVWIDTTQYLPFRPQKGRFIICAVEGSLIRN